MSETFVIGDLPLFVIEIAVAPRSRAILSASTISFDEPECDMPMATSLSVRCEAVMACI